jgi:hypothetical protein
MGVLVQIASTHEPTQEFQDFTKEFFLAFGELWARSAPIISGSGSIPEAPKLFFLIERRDRGKWEIGLCEPLTGEQPIGFASAELFFQPLWVMEGQVLKNEVQARARAKEAAKFLFGYISRQKI